MKPDPGPSRGMLKPSLQWKAGPAAVPAKTTQQAQAQKRAGLGSNSVPQSQLSLEQLKKMAASRGIPLEKLIAQMVQQYLKEDGQGG